MPLKFKSPLSKEDLARIDRLLAATAETAEFCAACERAHLDVTSEMRANSEQRKIAEAIKREFFPDAR